MNPKMYYTEEHFTTHGFRERIHLLNPARRFVAITVRTPLREYSFDSIERMLGRHNKLRRGEFMAGKRSIHHNLPFGSTIVVLYERK